MAPEGVIKYVIIHELAHTKEMNHSPDFWKIVNDILPDYQKSILWLKQYGHLCDL
jgi:predicted metal-dependent hydrolase